MLMERERVKRDVDEEERVKRDVDRERGLRKILMEREG